MTAKIKFGYFWIPQIFFYYSQQKFTKNHFSGVEHNNNNTPTIKVKYVGPAKMLAVIMLTIFGHFKA